MDFKVLFHFLQTYFKYIKNDDHFMVRLEMQYVFFTRGISLFVSIIIQTLITYEKNSAKPFKLVS
jgi:hypothetical protein